MSDVTRWTEYHDDPDHGMQESPTGEWVRHFDHLVEVERARTEAWNAALDAVVDHIDPVEERIAILRRVQRRVAVAAGGDS